MYMYVYIYVCKYKYILIINFNTYILAFCPGGMEQWSSHSPQEQKIVGSNHAMV
jgi:hypothetical protein